MKLTHKCNW